MTEIVIELQPKQKQFLKAIEETPITFYGGAKGGGKSKALQLIQLIRRFKYPKSIGVIFRRTYPELEGNHIRPLFQSYPELKSLYNESKKIITFPNGSTLQFCHCENEKDISLYQGREFHDLCIDEAGQWTESMFKTLLGSNRSGQTGIAPRALLTGNPGGIGHGWLKRLFVDRRFNDRERAEDYAFIQAVVSDNKALMDNDPTYVHRLNSEPNEALRKAYLYGDWDIFAGQFFQEISKDVHLIKPFEIPVHWERFGSYDYGFNHPAAFGWFANDEDGNTYLYREFIKSQLRVDQFISHLKSFSDTRDLKYIVAGHDCWAKVQNKINVYQGENPPTIAEQFLKYDESNPNDYGLFLKRAIIDRISGAAQLRDYLAWQGKANKQPRLFIFDTCPITYDTISRMIFDPDRPEDVLKVDATDGDPMSGDDAYDMIRYGMMSRPMITEAIKPKIIKYSKEWIEQQHKNVWEKEKEYLEKFDHLGNDWPSEPSFES